VGRRVPGWAGFVAAPVVVFLTICSYHAYTRHYRTVSGNAAGSPVESAVLQRSTDPQALLGIADHFYWLNNGPAAAPLYARTEKLFSERGDARNELHAKVGRLRSEAETMSFVHLSRFLDEQLENPIVQSDKRLRLWCLIAKGYTDIEIDYRATKRDWLEAQEIANVLAEKQWANRVSTLGRLSRPIQDALLPVKPVIQEQSGTANISEIATTRPGEDPNLFRSGLRPQRRGLGSSSRFCPQGLDSL
jgi:hypothetical protein